MQSSRWEVLRVGAGEHAGTVLLDGVPHKKFCEAAFIYREGRAEETLRRALQTFELALNAFVDVIPGSTEPVCFHDRQTGRLLVNRGMEGMGATLKRKKQPGAGYLVSHASRADLIDRLLVPTRAVLDICVDLGHAKDGNMLVQDGWNAASQFQVNEAARMARDAGHPIPFRRSTGRYYSVELPTYVPPDPTLDPHLRDRQDRALKKHGGSIGVYRGWQLKEDLRSRGDEAFSMTFRSLHLGAVACGWTNFGRLVIIKDKPTGDKLVKPAAMTPEYAPVFFNKYIDEERRALDPRGWGLAEYEAACFAGDEEALDAPVFYTSDLTGLSADTARYAWNKSMRISGIKFGERYAWMHLGRHAATCKTLDEIEELDAPEDVKEQLRDELAEYMGWASKEEMLRIYGLRHFSRHAAKRALEFQSRHAPTPWNGPIPPVPQVDDPASLRALFGGRFR